MQHTLRRTPVVGDGEFACAQRLCWLGSQEYIQPPMKFTRRLSVGLGLGLLVFGFMFGFCMHAESLEIPKHGPDSAVQSGVPQGAVTKGTFKSSRVFEGTTRDYWLYVPSQYQSKNPAHLMVF